MSYVQGIDCRSSQGFVTDPDDCDFDGHHANDSGAGEWPVTTLQGNRVGWNGGVGGTSGGNFSLNATIDPRLAGSTQIGGGYNEFRFELPAPGDYAIRIAGGQAKYSGHCNVDLYDGTTKLATLCSGSTGGGDRFFDATGIAYLAADWPDSNTAATYTFATTDCRFRLNPAGESTANQLAHLHVEASASGGTAVDLTGVSATGAVGDFTVAGKAGITLTGVSATGALGSIDVTAGGAVSVILSGVAGTGSVGDLSVAGEANLTLAGVFATGSVGDFSIAGDASVSLTGVSGTGHVGTLSTLTGIIVAIPAVSATGEVGTLVISGTANVSLTGVQAQSAVGELLTNLARIVAHSRARTVVGPFEVERRFIVDSERRTILTLKAPRRIH